MATIAQKRKYFKDIGYKPHDKQWLFHKSQARFRIAVCGRRFGKSLMSARDMTPDLFKPKKVFWIVAPNYSLGEKEFRVIWNDIMVRGGLAKDKTVKGRYNKQHGMSIEFPWQTIIEVKSADHPNSLVGEALDGVILAEAAKLKYIIWDQYVRPALADKKGYAIMSSTPEGRNWLYHQYLLSFQEDDYEGFQFPSWDNKAVFPLGRRDPEILLSERTMPTDAFEQEIGASFKAFAGQVYDEFDENIHIKPHDFNPDWPNYQFWDWGFTNPLVCLDVQITPDDKVIVWREYYRKGVRLEQAIEELKERKNPEGYKIDCSFGDPADPEAIDTVSELWAPCYGDPDCKTNWRHGINLVKGFLKVHEEEDDESWTKFQVDPSCYYTIEEFSLYRMMNTKLMKNDPIEKPVKKNDHCMDCIRYGLMHIFELGSAYSLVEVRPANVISTSEFLVPRKESLAVSGIFNSSNMGKF